MKLLNHSLAYRALLRTLPTTTTIGRPSLRNTPPPVEAPCSEDLLESATTTDDTTPPVDPLANFAKTQVRDSIQKLKALDLPPATFNQRYAQLAQTADSASLQQSGLTEKHKMLTDLHASIQRSHEHLQYYARALEVQLEDSPQLMTFNKLAIAMQHLEGMRGRYFQETQFFREAAAEFKKHPLSPPSPPHVELLLRAIEASHDRHAIFNAIELPCLTNDDQQVVYPTAADRLVAIKACLPKASSGFTKEALGGRLLHLTLHAPHLSEEEKVEIIKGLARLNADLNLRDSYGRTPLHTALENRGQQPHVAQALEEVGARLPACETPRLSAHLSAVGGTIPFPPKGPDQKTIPLEGLSERMAEDGLDPVFQTTLQQLIEDAPLNMQEPLNATLKAWATASDYPSFINALQSAKQAETGRKAPPSVIMTGWSQPSGHAIGFVFNQEADGGYLYACNTGNLKDDQHCVVKYQVVDYDKLLSFFEAGARDRNNTLSFFLGSVEPWGLERCPEEEQLPENVDRAPQKRGHCPITARKACALALLWSTSRVNNVDPALVKATYKDLTSGLRREGAARTTDSQSPELKGKTLVSLLTKLDRPGFEALAYEMADTILRKHGSFLWRYWYKSSDHVPEPHSSDYLATIRSALEATGQDVASIKTANKEDLATHAEQRGHPKAAQILRELIGEP